MNEGDMKGDHSALIFGEVLFDVFENGNEVLGGAPFNVAWHLQGFGIKPVLISRIGTDDRGRKILEAMKKWGMLTRYIQIDSHFATGIVTVDVKHNEPHFRIHSEMAYDFIAPDLIDEALFQSQSCVLYHGTLALRSVSSYQALQELKRKSTSKTFYDVNLRDPWWEKDLLLKQLNEATWVKCNEDELTSIGDLLEITTTDLNELAIKLLQKFDLNTIIITRGAKGAIAFSISGEKSTAPPCEVEPLVDTVGAGDAFTAVSILGFLEGWNLENILVRANDFAAQICKIQGATLNDPLLYENYKNKWDL
jgi:fructokinase